MRTSVTIVIVVALLLVAAAISGVFGPAEDRVAALTPEACYEAAVAAAAKPNPTNVPCDWKAVEAASPGAAFNGRFEAATEGVSGRLVVMEQAGKPARLAFSTAGSNPRYICTAALEATRGDDVLVAKPADIPGCEISLRSGTTPGLVIVTATNACDTLCNMRGSLAGDFRLMPH